VERIDEADVTVAAQAEDVRHLLPHEVVDDHLTAVEHILGHEHPWLTLPRRYSRLWRGWYRGAMNSSRATRQASRVRLAPDKAWLQPRKLQPASLRRALGSKRERKTAASSGSAKQYRTKAPYSSSTYMSNFST